MVMSTQYKKSSEVPTSVLCERLKQLSDAVTKGSSGDHEFTMRIPAECDRDADLVMAEAARRLLAAEEKLSAMEEQVRLANNQVVLHERLLDVKRSTIATVTQSNGELVEEVMTLRAYKEAAEKQKPFVYTTKFTFEAFAGGATFGGNLYSGEYVQESSATDWVPLYKEPVSATRPAPCEHLCEAKAFEIEIRQLKAQVEEYERATKLSGKVNAKLMRELMGNQVVWIPDVDWLAAVIRKVDGNNLLGAGAMAEKIVDEMLEAAPSHSQQSARITSADQLINGRYYWCKFTNPKVVSYGETVIWECAKYGRDAHFLAHHPVKAELFANLEVYGPVPMPELSGDHCPSPESGQVPDIGAHGYEDEVMMIDGEEGGAS